MAPPSRNDLWGEGSKLMSKLNDYINKVGKKHEVCFEELSRKRTRRRVHQAGRHPKADAIVHMLIDSLPLISERTALICAMLYTVIYVAPFYLSPTLRSSPLVSRDSPSVIKARVRAVGLTCLTCTTITVSLLVVYGRGAPNEVLRTLGVWPVHFVDIAKALGLVTVLFVGPLYESIVVDEEWRGWSLSSFKEGIFDSWTGYRNYLIAPATEELVFRAAIIPLFAMARVPATWIIFTTPLIFGLAHVHHLVEFVQSQTPQGHTWPSANVLMMGLLRSLFQFTYTSLFGFFAAFLFLRTGNLWAVILVHSFCNWQGVPRLSGRVGQFVSPRAANMTPDVAQGKRDDENDGSSACQTGNIFSGGEDKAAEATPDGPRSLGIGWTTAYYTLLPIGAFGFYVLLWPLTDSSNALLIF